jgi:multidrug efflux pump subunit AcrB
VPVLCVWLLRGHHHPNSPTAATTTPGTTAPDADDSASRPAAAPVTRPGLFASAVRTLVGLRWVVVPAYLLAAGAVIALVGGRLGTEIFPAADAGQIRLRMRAPDGTRIEKTEKYAKAVLDAAAAEAGEGNVAISVGYVGVVPASYPINSVYEWMGGPHEAVLRVALRPHSGVRVAEWKERIRARLAESMPEVQLSFEAGDLVAEVMSLGSPTPVEIAVSGPSLPDDRKHAEKILAELAGVPGLRDVSVRQSLDYPTLEVDIDRQKAGLEGVSASAVGRSLVSATFSSRFVVANFWPDPASGIGYQVQVEVPQTPASAGKPGTPLITDAESVRNLPVKGGPDGDRILLRDVAKVTAGTAVGEYDRYNMKRMVTITADISGTDPGSVARAVRHAVHAAGEPPRGVSVEVRGQVKPLGQMLTGLGVGLALAVAVVFLMLTANYQSPALALAVSATVPGVLAGVVLALWATGTTLSVQSFIGAIMAVGVAVANAILLVTFAEAARRAGPHAGDARAAAVDGAAGRLRAVLMTAAAMVAGMVPMALGLGEGGDATAPLARAVIGGLLVATPTTLLVLPAVFALLRSRATVRSASLDPSDPASPHYREGFDASAAR